MLLRNKPCALVSAVGLGHCKRGIAIEVEQAHGVSCVEVDAHHGRVFRVRALPVMKQSASTATSALSYNSVEAYKRGLFLF